MLKNPNRFGEAEVINGQYRIATAHGELSVTRYAASQITIDLIEELIKYDETLEYRLIEILKDRGSISF